MRFGQCMNGPMRLRVLLSLGAVGTGWRRMSDLRERAEPHTTDPIVVAVCIAYTAQAYVL